MTALPPERQGYGAPPGTLAVREAIKGAAARGVWNTVPPAGEHRIGGVRCLVFDPGGTKGSLLHIHGGAFRVGQPEQMGPFAATLAVRCGIRVICPAYRLAPEHPFPAALNDCRAVLAALAAEATAPIILSGDSAGGGLAASLMLLSRADRVPPVGLALLSAWLDLRVTAESFLTNAAKDPLFSAASAAEAAEFYLQGHDVTDPLVSPLLAPGDCFPPTLLNVGASEVLCDDTLAMHDRLVAAGVDVRLNVVEGMEHVAVTRDRSLTGADHTFERFAAFITERLL